MRRFSRRRGKTAIWRGSSCRDRLENLDFHAVATTEGLAQVGDGLAALDGLERGEDFGFRLLEAAWLGGFVRGDFH